MKCLICFLLVLSLSDAQDCPLPNNTEIENALKEFLSITGCTYDPTVLESVHYICLAQGSVIDTYRSVSIIATFTPGRGESVRTNIFQLTCASSVWNADTNGGLVNPDSSVIYAPTRTDCFQCNHLWGHDRCRRKPSYKLVILISHLACSSACNTGLRRCTSPFSDGCCSFFNRNGQCTIDDCTVSYGPNYIATTSNNFLCSELSIIIYYYHYVYFISL